MNKEVLKVLEQNAKATPQQISALTGVALQEVKDTIEKAEKERVVLRYKTIVHWEKLGDERVMALIEVKITPQRGVGFDALAERIYRFSEARSVYLVSGTYDLAVLVSAGTMHEVASFVSQKLSPLEGVQGTVTHFLLKRYKEDGEILGGKEETHRLAVSP
ncbi:MAG: Lrp/AsnC family transcriptional regulator [Dehalococcoidia bacterium]|nr:Lrp/AsnC family transcriptional regulator [Dehalococcoidia bacterium]